MDRALKDKISIPAVEPLKATPVAGILSASAAADRSDERDLVTRAQRGDRDAFRVLVEKYQQRACRLAWTVVKDRAEAEDVTQEAFVKAYLSLAGFENKSSFFSWLYRIVMNMAIDARRKRARRGGEVSFDSGLQGAGGNEERALSDVIPDEKPTPEATAIGAQSLALLKRSFEGLSEEQRLVVMLREVDGLSYDEIANSLGVARGTVMSRLFYARKKLQVDTAEQENESVRAQVEQQDEE